MSQGGSSLPLGGANCHLVFLKDMHLWSIFQYDSFWDRVAYLHNDLICILMRSHLYQAITLDIIHVIWRFKCLNRGFQTWSMHWTSFQSCTGNLICIIQDGWLFRPKRCKSERGHTIFLDIINVLLWFLCRNNWGRTCQMQYNIL